MGFGSEFTFAFVFAFDASGDDAHEAEVSVDALVEDVGVREGSEGGEGGVDDDGWESSGSVVDFSRNGSIAAVLFAVILV